jgi:hypothetical protein
MDLLVALYPRARPWRPLLNASIVSQTGCRACERPEAAPKHSRIKGNGMTKILQSAAATSSRLIESQRRRSARLVVAFGLTVLGYAWPVPYLGYGFSLVWFGPAAILEALAISAPADRGSRIVGLILSVPTGFGLFLGVTGAIDYVVRFGNSALHLLLLTAVTVVFSVIAALAGRRRFLDVWDA